MCGLVGIAGALALADERYMKKLLIFDFFRGTDSTGLAAVRKTNDDVHIAKIASHPVDLMDTKMFVNALSGAASKAFIGHNRAATVGKVVGINAHPFHCGHIVGAHNGTLTTKSWRALEEAIGEETDVDSLAIFKGIEKLGIKETIKLLEEGNTSRTGAWSLVWFNTADNTINFLRNKHRPLVYGYTNDGKCVTWASEAWMVRAAVDSSAGHALVEDKKKNDLWYTAEDFWYSWDIEQFINAKPGKFPKPVVQEVKAGSVEAPFVSSTTSYAGAGYVNPDKKAGQCADPFNREASAKVTHTRHSKISGTVSTARSGKKNDENYQCTFFEVTGTPNDPSCSIVDDAYLWMMATAGCSFCHEQIDLSKPGVAFYPEEGTALCAECTGDTTKNRVYLVPKEFDKLLNERGEPDELLLAAASVSAASVN